MKKLLLIAAFAAVVPFCADAASPVFDDAGAFTVAKAVKLGRGKAYKINGGQSFGKGGFDETKSCCAHCANCNTKTGECTACETGFELKNGSCVEKQCDEHCTSCSKGTCYDCESGYELNNGKCEKIACGAGTYEKNGSCVSICTGVTCNTAKGFQTVAYDGSCCCERGSCSAGQYLNGTSCVSCPKGSYSKGGSMTACIRTNDRFDGGDVRVRMSYDQNAVQTRNVCQKRCVYAVSGGYVQRGIGRRVLREMSGGNVRRRGIDQLHEMSDGCRFQRGRFDLLLRRPVQERREQQLRLLSQRSALGDVC